MMHRNGNQMEVNGLFATLNTPEALKGEEIHGLPPYDPRPAYAVDEYPACPENWMHGSSKASSYFVPVEAGRGMWFDFTVNAHHKHHVAVVVSVQGINPITGQKMTELCLEKYKDKCPVHDIDFQQDRFCPTCGYKWPGQNYIATTTGQSLWIDGFRNEKGEVRQYVISEEEASGVAAQLIGEDRVFAIGYAFYLSKKPKPEQPRPYLRTACCSFGGGTQVMGYNGLESLSFNDSDAGPDMAMLEVAAGAKIQQEVGVDPEDIDFWETEPAGMIYVNYVPLKVAEKILAAGKREEAKDGFLNGLKVGNK